MKFKGIITKYTGVVRAVISGENHYNWKGGLPKCSVCGKQISRGSTNCREHNLKNSGKNHHGWKGDLVGYGGLHYWVHKEKGEPKECEHCGRKNIRLYWANKSHEYKRDVDDWLSLCAKCHSLYDGIKK